MDQPVIKDGQNARNPISNITTRLGIGDSDVLKIFQMVNFIYLRDSNTKNDIIFIQTGMFSR